MKLGCNPLCWMNSDFPFIPNQKSVHECIKEIAQIGYKGVELEDPFIKVLDELPKWLSENQLACIGKWHSTYLLQNSLEKEMQKLSAHIDILESLRADVVILSECTDAVQQQKETPLSKRPVCTDWSRLCEGLEAMAQLIEKRGFKSAYHHHMGTVIQTKEDIDKLMDSTESLGLLFDSGHLAFAQSNPLEVLEKHISRVAHVHCKNVRPSVLAEKLKHDASFYSAVLDGVFTVPCDDENALIDFSKIIDRLKTDNYQGWVVMEAEQDPSKADPYTYAELGFKTLHRLIVELSVCEKERS